MSVSSTCLNALRDAAANPAGGVVGLVDTLLALCRKHCLKLEWQVGKCCVRALGDEETEVVDVELRKSVFRAILARVAALCEEQTPGSFSPYGGQGELSAGPHPGMRLHVAWVNTLGEQSLTVNPAWMKDIPPRAYEKWQKAGCPPGKDKRHWLEAEAELKAEMMASKDDGIGQGNSLEGEPEIMDPSLRERAPSHKRESG